MVYPPVSAPVPELSSPDASRLSVSAARYLRDHLNTSDRKFTTLGQEIRFVEEYVELYSLGEDTYIADTPGFASLDVMMTNVIEKDQLQYDFIDFKPYLGQCRFHDCAHLKEPDCAVRAAVQSGEIDESRYRSYIRLYELSAQHKFWEYKDEQ